MAKKNNTADLGFEDKIWKAADLLRGSIDAAEYKNVVLGLIFLKYISDCFDVKHQQLVDEGGMQVFLDAKQACITYQGSIDLKKSINWQSELMRQLQLVVRTLPAEEKFKKIITKIKKGGLL